MFTKPGAGGDEVEHLDDLGAEAASESGFAADGVFAGDAALFVGRCPERKVGDAEEAVVSDYAVAGGPNVRQAGCHRLVDRHGTSGTDLCPRLDEQIGVRTNTDNDQHEVDVPAEGLPVWSDAIEVKSGAAVGPLLIRVTVERV
jgi:hypothetical protein